MNKLDICKQTRKITADSLFKTLEKALNSNKKISESFFRDLWLKELREYKEVFPNGWYDPPPFGIVVLFATHRDKRADFVNLRPKEFWPRDDIFLDRKNGFAYLFASPVDRQTAIAGDFAINIYFGKNPKITDHLKRSQEVDRKIFDFAQIDMAFSDVFGYATKIIEQAGLRNNIISATDSNNVNTGHTIPFSYEDLSKDEKQILDAGDNDWQKVIKMISKKRIFVNANEKLEIKPEIAFTIEPALKVIGNLEIPMTMLHHTAVFHADGSKELLTNFDEIFALVGMDYML